MEERVPRSTGEVLSDAVSLLRRHFKAMYLLSLPFCAADVVFREAGQSAMQVLRTSLKDPSNIDSSAVWQALAAMAGGVGFIIAAVLALQLLSAGIIELTSSAWHGRPVELSRATGAVVRRGAAIVFTTFLFSFGFAAAIILPSVVLGGLAAILDPLAGGIVGIVVLLIATFAGSIFFFLRWGLYSQAVVVEDRLGSGALSRSTALMASRGLPFFESAKFRLSVLFLASFALSTTIQGLFIGPRVFMAFTLTDWKLQDGLPPLAAMPIWFVIPFGLIEIATNALIVPFSSVLMTLFYYDVRVRYEAVDLA